MSEEQARSIRFHGWELRPEERLLLVNGLPAQVGGRAFELLMTLARHRGRMVSKPDLLKAGWPGLVVEENNISVQIAALRRALGTKVIVTVPGRGYQLVAEPITEPGTQASDGTGAVPSQQAGGAANPEPSTGPILDQPLELLGRQRELVELLEKLTDARLVSIVGAGGVGKTALAREAFARRCALLQQPGSWVDLAPIREPRQVTGLVAQALGIELSDGTEVGDLVAALSQTSGFVVLDNCEHLLGGIRPLVAASSEKAPHIRWLATSREPLAVPGEYCYRLLPLAVPRSNLTPAQAIEFGALALLCKRIAESDRRFRLSEANLASACAICARLDGLPLAIEMAAARVATFGIDETCRRLEQRLKLLAPGTRPESYRHDTLQAMYDWSYGLLSPCEQAVFRRLEPFLSGFRADMAQEVASDDDQGGSIDSWQALDALGTLVDKSLVQRSAGEPGRFHLLESAREYARSLLEASGELGAVHARHARAVAGWVAHVHADADRLTDMQWVEQYAPERFNVRAALAWACDHRASDLMARLVSALAMMDWFLCHQAEVLQCNVPLDVLALAEPALRAKAYLEFSWAHYSDGDHALGTQLARDAFDLFTTLGERALAYRALAQYTRLLESRRGMDREAREAWSRLQQLDDRQVPLRTRLFCAISAGLFNRPDLTVERMQELGRLAQTAGFDAIAAIGGCNLTDKLLLSGRYLETVTTADRLLLSSSCPPRASAFILHNKAAALIALNRHDEAYEAARKAFHAMPSVAHFLVDSCALAAVREGRFADAAVLHGCGSHLREEIHEEPDGSEARAIAETSLTLAREMNRAQREELMALGAAMTASEVLAIKVFTRAQPGTMDAQPAGH